MKMNRALESLTAYKAGPPLDAIRDAHEALEAGHAFGKLVLEP